MNRRQFLQALASLGASISIPVVLQSASAAQVDEAWAKALEDPWYFEVNDYGTIVDPGVAMPRIRADVFDVWDRLPRDPEHLIGEVESIGPLVSAFQGLAAGEREDLEYELSMLDDFDEEERARRRSSREDTRATDCGIADQDDGWKALVRRDGKAGIDRYWDFIGRWLEEPIDWDEYEWFPRDWNGQGTALEFFHRMDRDALYAIGVVIVEGDCPGSSYFAAELREELVDANAAAQRLALPFRFRAEGVVMSDELYSPGDAP